MKIASRKNDRWTMLDDGHEEEGKQTIRQTAESLVESAEHVDETSTEQGVTNSC